MIRDNLRGTTARPDVPGCSSDQGVCGRSPVSLKSPIYNMAAYTSLHDISHHRSFWSVCANRWSEHTQMCTPGAEVIKLQSDFTDRGTCSYDGTFYRRQRCNSSLGCSFTHLANFSKEFQRLCVTSLHVLSHISPCMHTVHGLVIIWSSAHRHF